MTQNTREAEVEIFYTENENSFYFMIFVKDSGAIIAIKICLFNYWIYWIRVNKNDVQLQDASSAF